MRSGDILLELSERLFAFLVPDELLVSSKQFIEREKLIGGSRDKSVERRDPSG